MKKFTVRIRVATQSSELRVQVEANSQFDAKKIAEAQYPNAKILSVDTGR